MRIKILGLIIMILVWTSCTSKVIANFEIVNNTGHEIDSLKIEPNTSEMGKFISIKKEGKVKYKSDMTGIMKVDGAYELSFLLNKQKKTMWFGYYTNGYPLEKVTKIVMERDTILINQIFGNY